MKWLKAGVLEDGKRTVAREGTPQGGSISPLLANVYLHYVLDDWADWWRKKVAQGDVILVRYADDFIVGFQHQGDAERFREELAERLRRFHLELHPDKTRLIRFGRFAARDRQRRGQGKPETFDFLGFTHVCGKTKSGAFQVVRRTIAQTPAEQVARREGGTPQAHASPCPCGGEMAGDGHRWPRQPLRCAR